MQKPVEISKILEPNIVIPLKTRERTKNTIKVASQMQREKKICLLTIKFLFFLKNCNTAKQEIIIVSNTIVNEMLSLLTLSTFCGKNIFSGSI